MSAPLLELSAVEKRYKGGAHGTGPYVLRGVDLSLDAGETAAVVGRSGCGKSTLLNLIAGLDEPSAGSLRVDGEDLAGLDAAARADLRARKLGLVFQAHHLLPQCTALENVMLPTLAPAAAEKRAGAEARARELLERVGLADRLDHRPARLSGGECQRVAVVRALILEPQLLLLDEPTGALDDESAESLLDLLGELNREQGVAMLMVTHSREFARRMRRVLRMEEGLLQQEALTP